MKIGRFTITINREKPKPAHVLTPVERQAITAPRPRAEIVRLDRQPFKVAVTIIKRKPPVLTDPCAACHKPRAQWPFGCMPDDRFLRVAEDPRPPRPGGYFDGPIGIDCSTCTARPSNHHHEGCPERKARP